MGRMSPPSQRDDSFGIMAIILTLIGWASVPLFLKHFADSIDLWTCNGWRYGFSAFLWAPVLVVGLMRNRLPRGLWRAAIVPSIINGFGQVTFVWAHYKIDPGLITFGLRSQMVFVAIGAYLIFPQEREIIRSSRYLVGLVLLMLGTAGAMLLGSNPLVGAQAWGVILSVSSGCLFAAYGLAVRKYMSQFNSILAFATISQYTAAAMVALMLLMGDSHGLAAPRMPPDQFVLLLLSAVIGIAVGHVLYYVSIARLGVAVSSGVLQLHPFLVAIGSLILFKEELTALQWTGGCIAVGGAVLMLAVQQRLSRLKRISQMDLAIAEGEAGA
jgi:drug/metabolite transporter (DMT)-like permease